MANNINLDSFADGALHEKFNLALKEVLENLMDPNTEAKKPRRLDIQLTFTTTDERSFTYVDIDTKLKLQRPKSTQTTVIIGKDGKGQVLATEYKNQVPGQSIITITEDGEVGTTAEENNLEGIKLVK